MDFEISFEKKLGYFIINTSGETSPDDIEDSLKQVFQSKYWNAGTHLLYNNHKEITDKLSNKDLKEISKKFTQFNDKLSKSKIALIMPKDLAYGLARMWESQTEYDASFQIQIFRSFKDAQKWIEEGLTPD